jgi:hypothetical protein
MLDRRRSSFSTPLFILDVHKSAFHVCLANISKREKKNMKMGFVVGLYPKLKLLL